MQHAKGRTGDCPGPRKETTTRRTVTQGAACRFVHTCQSQSSLGRGEGGRDALAGKGPQRRPQQRLGRRLEEVTKAVGGGYCRLPLRVALAVRGTVAGRMFAPPSQRIPPPPQRRRGRDTKGHKQHPWAAGPAAVPLSPASSHDLRWLGTGTADRLRLKPQTSASPWAVRTEHIVEPEVRAWLWGAVMY